MSLISWAPNSVNLPEGVVGKSDIVVEVVVMGSEVVVFAVLDIITVDAGGDNVVSNIIFVVDVVLGISVGVVLDNDVKVPVGVVGTKFVVEGVFEAVLIDVAVAGVVLGFDSTKWKNNC